MSNNLKKGALYMICAVFLFAVMQVLIAVTAERIPLFEQLVFRNLVALIISAYFVKKENLPMWGKKENRKVLISRVSSGYIGMITLFFASGNGNQGDVSTIVKMSPFITIILAGSILKEKVERYKWISVLIAFMGLVCVTGPRFNSDVEPLIAAFISAIFTGVAYTFISVLKGREHPWVIVFFFSATSTVASFVLMLVTTDLVMPTPFELLLLIGIGIFAAAAQILLTRSYAVAKASDVSIYNYFGIIFSMILGAMLLNEEISNSSLIGAGLVIVAGALVYVGAKRTK